VHDRTFSKTRRSKEIVDEFTNIHTYGNECWRKAFLRIPCVCEFEGGSYRKWSSGLKSSEWPMTSIRLLLRCAAQPCSEQSNAMHDEQRKKRSSPSVTDPFKGQRLLPRCSATAAVPQAGDWPAHLFLKMGLCSQLLSAGLLISGGCANISGRRRAIRSSGQLAHIAAVAPDVSDPGSGPMLLGNSLPGDALSK